MIPPFASEDILGRSWQFFLIEVPNIEVSEYVQLHQNVILLKGHVKVIYSHLELTQKKYIFGFICPKALCRLKF